MSCSPTALDLISALWSSKSKTEQNRKRSSERRRWVKVIRKAVKESPQEKQKIN